MPLNSYVRRHIVRYLNIQAVALFAATGWAPVVANGSGASTPHRPNVAEVRRIESTIKMPHGADSLQKYVRYYYALVGPEGRLIKAIYIDPIFVQRSQVPSGKVAIVSSEADIPVPEDAECSVVFVEYRPRGSSPVAASCSAGLFRHD